MLAAWFGLVMAAPAVLHSCPMVMAAASADATGEAHAHHGAGHAGHQRPEAPTPCQCLGSCAVASPLLLAGATTIPVAVHAPRPTDIRPSPAGLAAVQSFPHAQPFATAPPLHIG